MKEYYIVTFKDGKIRDFNKECGQVVDFASVTQMMPGRMLCFQKKVNDYRHQTLAIINIDEIKLIELIEGAPTPILEL